MATCPNCGNETSEGAVFCDRCGTRLPEAAAPAASVPAAPAPETLTPAAPVPTGGSVICPACGAGNVPGEAFCDYCGSPLDAPAPDVVVPAAVPEAVAPAPEAAAPAPEVAAPAPAPEVPAPAVPESVPVPVPAAAAEMAAPVPPAAPGAANICPACGAAALPNEAFCANCGASLAQAPIAPEPVAEVEAELLPEAPVAPVAPLAVPEPAVPVVEPVAAAPAPVTPLAPVPPPAVGLNCPACGAEMEPGDAFCSSCGFALKAVTPPAAPAPAPAAPAPAPAPAPAAAPASGARLVVAASGAEIPLPPGNELLIGREDPVSGIYPEVDLTPHGGEDGGVSRRHARIVVENGEYYVEDLDSTNFTFVNKQKLAPRTRQRVVDGDEIRTGRVALVFHK